MGAEELPERLTKRELIDAGHSETMPPGSPNNKLIEDELQSIKELADSHDDDLEVPWGNSLKLDEDDWILRQIFETSGLNPRRAGHWRLLLGILAEFQVDPNRPDNPNAFYSADSISSTRWTSEERQELFQQASEIAATAPKLSRPQIATKLANDPRWKRTGVKWEGEKNRPSAIRSIIEEEIKAGRSKLEEGSLRAHPEQEDELRALLRPFRQNKLK